MLEKTLVYISVSMFDRPNTTIRHPAQAVHEHENCYRITEESDDPEHEYWQFSFDEIVHCKEHKFAEGEFGLIAFEKCDHNSKS